MKENKVPAVIYARVSTSRQAEKGLSIPDQIDQMTEYSNSRNYGIKKIYEEPGSSATEDNRPAFQDMMADAFSPTPPFEVILVLTTSRFFRNRMLASYYKNKLRKKGIRVIAISQEVADDPQGELIEGFYELIDEHESKMNGYHTLRAMKANAKKGNINGGNAPFGYSPIKIEIPETEGAKLQLEINPQEAIIVRKIKEMYLKTGHGAKRIAEDLNRLGYRTRRGKLWQNTTILGILKSETYNGIYYFNRTESKTGRIKSKEEWIKITVPAYWEDNEYDLIQKKLKENSPVITNPKVVSSPMLLAGLLKCGKCGGTITYDGTKTFDYYNCSTYKRKGKDICTGCRVSMNALDEAVISHVSNKLFTTDRIKELLSELLKTSNKLKRNNQTQKKSITQELRDVQKRLSSLYNCLETGTVTPEAINDRIIELKRKENDLKADLNKIIDIKKPPPSLSTAGTITKFQNLVKRTFAIKDSGLAKQYLKLFIKKIKFDGKTLEILANSNTICQIMADSSKKKPATQEATSLISDSLLSKSVFIPTVCDWLPKR